MRNFKHLISRYCARSWFNKRLFSLKSQWKITWWCWSTAHGLEVLGSGLTKVCWGRQRVTSRRSTGILGWRVTVGTNFGPWCFCRFPRRFMKPSFLITGCSWCYTWRRRKLNECISKLMTDLMHHNICLVIRVIICPNFIDINTKLMTLLYLSNLLTLCF